MCDGEVCVCFFAENLETNNPRISRHLSYLKRVKLVAGPRDGKWMHYRINESNNKKAREVSSVEMFEDDEEMQTERRNLANACCARPLVSIKPTRKSKKRISEAL